MQEIPARVRRMRSIALLLLGVIVLAACSLTAIEDEVPERTRADLATVQARSPMVRATWAAATAEARGEPAPPVATTPLEPAVNPNATESAPRDPLAAALLHQSELGGGPWTIDARGARPSLEMCGATALQQANTIASFSTQAYVATYGDLFQQWVFWAPGNAGEVMDYVHANFGCAESSYPGISENSMLLSPFPRDVPGEQPFARQYTVNFTNPLYSPVSGNVVITRVGDFIIAMAQIAYRPVEPALTLMRIDMAIELLQSPDIQITNTTAAPVGTPAS